MDKKKYIMEDLQNKYNYIKDNYEVFCLCLQGSQNYDLDVYTDEYKSDIDVKAILIPSLKDIVYNRKPISTTLVMEDNSHIDLKDIRLMFETFEKQNINFIEILFTDYKIINPKYQELAERLFSLADEVAKINWNASLRTISGMSMEKFKALKHPYPSLKDRIEKYGYDSKQLHHIVRLNYFIKDLIAGKSYKDCLKTVGARNDYLKFIKILGNIPLAEAEILAVEHDIETRTLKDKYMLEHDIVNRETINKLKDIIYEAIKLNFIAELNCKII